RPRGHLAMASIGYAGRQTRMNVVERVFESVRGERDLRENCGKWDSCINIRAGGNAIFVTQ
ncbi:MAG: hypothetical protein ACYST6_06810, partial [Planctomycetota bacterium]